MSIEIELNQSPDTLINRELIVRVTNLESGEKILSPDFITVIGASETSQRETLEVATQDNTVDGIYQVDLIARFSGSEKFCSVSLQIEATDFVFSVE